MWEGTEQGLLTRVPSVGLKVPGFMPPAWLWNRMQAVLGRVCPWGRGQFSAAEPGPEEPTVGGCLLTAPPDQGSDVSLKGDLGSTPLCLPYTGSLHVLILQMRLMRVWQSPEVTQLVRGKAWI